MPSRPSPPSRNAALRGAARLATEGTLAVTEVVEAMHARIERPPGWPTPSSGRSGGLAGLVYGSVRAITRGVGGSLDLLLGQLPQALAESPQRPAHGVVQSALNGVLGDHLAASGNPLALRMQLLLDGEPLPDDPAALRQRLLPRLAAAPAGLLLLVHGLCMSPAQWRQRGHDHGQQLGAALGRLPLYLRYNTGLPVADNGRQLAALLARLHRVLPAGTGLQLLAHSMGGLVCRSAFHQGRTASGRPPAWARRVSDLVCLGTPHLGAPLEKAGRGLELLLDAAPYAAPLARVTRLRSAGITDLRLGLGPEVGLPPPPTRCWAIAGTVGEGSLKPSLLGDGLVRVDSALGRHRDPARRLAFAPERQAVLNGVGHIALLSSRRAARQLQDWLGRVGD